MVVPGSTGKQQHNWAEQVWTHVEDDTPPEPASEGPVVNTELTENLTLCSNRTPLSAFQQQAVPWFTANADQSTAARIARFQESGGSTEHAAIALGHLQAEQAVPALEPHKTRSPCGPNCASR